MSTAFFLIFALILATGFLTLSELAILTSRKSRLREAARDSSRARTALELASAPERFLSAVQVWITLISLLIGYFGGESLGEKVEHELVNFPAVAPYAHWAGVAVSVLFILFVLVLLGELLPKRIAILHPERIAVIVAVPMKFVSAAAAPLAWTLSHLSTFLLKLLRIRAGDQGQVTEEEIKLLVAEGVEQGVIDTAEKNMVNRVLTLGDRSVASLMTPRTRITWLDIAAPLEDNLKIMEENPFSRYPVIRGSDRDVVGIMQIKDLTGALAGRKKVELFKNLAPPVFVPDTAFALALLEEFRDAEVPLALVVDEYGEIQGLVTPTDLLLAVVGRLAHVAEADTPPAVQRDDGSWLVNGSVPTEDLKELLGIVELPQEDEQDYHTAAGLMIAQFGRIPAVGEHFDWKGFRFEVVDLDGARIDKILVARLPEAG